jgi:EutQ-like cupin domain
MSYTRLYASEDGQSHFEQVEFDLALTDYAPPAPPLELSAMTAAKEWGFMRAPAGWQSDWHTSTARNLFVVLSGDWEVTASDGECRRFSTGDVLLVEDTTGKGHSSRVLSEAESVALLIRLDD